MERATEELARRTNRRSFLGIMGRAAVALTGGSFVAAALEPQRAEAFHICGHIYTTGSCPHPYFPHTRLDQAGYAVHPLYGYPVDDEGRLYRSRTQKRTKICSHWVPERFPYTGEPELQGTWSRCCNHRIRRLWDCCSFSRKRINGDASLTGYCYHGRRVFCVTYRDTDIRC
ncbi:MAG: hypothetical protein ABR600_14065 [Actinomycetota bacterium]